MDTWAWHSCACWTSKGRSSLCAQENCHAGTKHIYRSENTLNLKSNIIIYFLYDIWPELDWILLLGYLDWIGFWAGFVMPTPYPVPDDYLANDWNVYWHPNFLKKERESEKKRRRISWQASVKKSEQHVPFLMSDLLCVTNVLKIQLKWLLAWKKKKKTGSLNLFHVYFNFNYFSFPTSN